MLGCPDQTSRSPSSTHQAPVPRARPRIDACQLRSLVPRGRLDARRRNPASSRRRHDAVRRSMARRACRRLPPLDRRRQTPHRSSLASLRGEPAARIASDSRRSYPLDSRNAAPRPACGRSAHASGATTGERNRAALLARRDAAESPTGAWWRASPRPAARFASLRKRRCSRSFATARSLAPTSCLCIACDGFGGVALVFVVHLRSANGWPAALVPPSLDASVRSTAAIARPGVAEESLRTRRSHQDRAARLGEFRCSPTTSTPRAAAR